MEKECGMNVSRPFFLGGGGGGGRGDVGRRCVRAQKAAAKETNLLLNIGLLWDLKSP